MEMTIISLGFDIVVMVLLAVTIFYAIRLSRHLDTFRSNRSNMEQLIRELSSQITRAQEGITVLDDLASTKGDELRKYINKAQSLVDELDIITGSADSIAERLETLGTRGREIIDGMEHGAAELVYPGAARSAPVEAKPELRAARPGAAARYEDTLTKFAIRDPDFEENDDATSSGDDGLMSQAERDLAEALKRRGQKS